ncbi:hypothetical protein OHA21_43005 [Actinoplanes sp. NBC_00393]|uniref:hypothetical protein n=1 Tax=Actinoplanes sp. NBC_00393 TaxID=2975953 RepID=UPI002E1CEB07
MLRARRLATAVVVASLTVGGLAACRSEPTVAAYLGDTERVSEQQVQEIWDEAYDVLAENPAPPAEGEQAKPVQVPFTRGDVVHALVTRELLGQVAGQHGVTLPAQMPYEEGAAQIQLPPDLQYVRLYVDNLVLRNQLMEKVQTSTPPADDDLRLVYDTLAANGGVQPGQTFETWKSEQVTDQNKQVVATAAVLRDELEAAAEDLSVKVNPRYQPYEVNLLQVNDGTNSLDLLSAEFGEDQSVPVADVS